MDKLILTAAQRTTSGKANAKLRAAGKTPVVAYGHGFDAASLEIDARELEHVYRTAGSGRLVELKLNEGKPHNVLIHEVQQDYRGNLVHADLYVVRMDEEIQTEVQLHFVGESTAVYQQEGTLVKSIEEVEIRCLPANLPDSLEVDISVLDDFTKRITLADLTLPKDVVLVEEELGLVIASVEPPRTEEEMAELDEAPAEVELPEGVQEEQVAVKDDTGGRGDR